MHFRPPATSFSLYTILARHFSSATKLPKLPNLSKIPSKYKPQAINQAQKALTDYLHATRSLPYLYAEQISKNSLFSLSDAVSKVKFSPVTFSKSFERFLSLGKLYREEILIFGKDPVELSRKLNGFKEYGFSNVTVIGICLVFPYVLGEKLELGNEIDALFGDLRKVFIDFDLVSCVEGNVDAWVEVCRKIRVFYDLGCEKGKMGELMGRRKIVFLRYPEEVLVKKAEFFSRLSVSKSDVGLLLLEKSKILDFDLEDRVISVSGFLKNLGMSENELKSIAEEYPYALGRNKMANLPFVMRALDLHEWFFTKMKVGNHCLFGTYTIGNPSEDLDKDYNSRLDSIQSSKTTVHTLRKLDFLHSIGFGENNMTMKVLANSHGTSTELQERFDCLLRAGIQFSKLCKMVRLSPKILNQNPQSLEWKIKFLCEEIGSSLQYLDLFPAYLCYDLEKRIKPRYRFHTWLTEKGWSAKTYSLASMIATSEKSFLARISGIHPAAPKLWFDFISNQNCSNDWQGCELGNNVESLGRK
ncbi:mitochondrial transcription termination factor family protein [Actinidia rufa]|uniref:Mitochondrial transcription termination factor family protein n=1 Tax=Actinidia rufa TaxID=165716 RepID=A0A7J0FQ35_9ERIC|nr:mitochondrial transcription termination factor family protein [Actinidia rufa]